MRDSRSNASPVASGASAAEVGTPSPWQRSGMGQSEFLDEIARNLAATDPQGKKFFAPTDEQRRIILAPLEPSVVVAGAGSGKTETMRLRMLWLIYGLGVDPASIMGLTFTTKAALELQQRVHGAVRRLAPVYGRNTDGMGLPAISTYNSFANSVYRENSLLLGLDNQSQLLDEASSFLLMRRMVLTCDDPRLDDLDERVSSLTEQALAFAHAMVDNGVTAERVEQFAAATLSSVRAASGDRESLLPANAQKAVEMLPILAELGTRYAAEKRRLGLIDFADQVAGAAMICESAPRVVEQLLSVTQHVVLDEYQDTSAGQVRFLASLFRDRSIMAVGDPKQAIYRWRGAASGTIAAFHRDFSSDQKRGQGERTFSLTTSFRNDREILRVANALAEPLPEVQRLVADALSAQDEHGEGVDLGSTGSMDSPGDGTVSWESAEEKAHRDAVDRSCGRLVVRPKAQDGCVDVIFASSEIAEADQIARRCAAIIAESCEGETSVPQDGAPLIAVLCRARKDMSAIADALRAHGVACVIHGLGGVLSAPEVVDLVAIIRAALTDNSGNDLIRVLVGARYSIGPADIAALRDIGARLARVDWRGRPLAEEYLAEHAPEPLSLGETLREVARRRDTDPMLAGLSAVARSRLRHASALLDEVRALGHLPPVDLVEATMRVANLDIEIEANPRRDGSFEHLNAFLEAVAQVAATSLYTSITDILDWLEVAQDKDALPISVQARGKHIVEILTVHGAKGLEWDHVFVPQLVVDSFPTRNQNIQGWLKSGTLPYPLRYDRSDLPKINLGGHADAASFKLALTAFNDEERKLHAQDERRLAYVAVTRARKQLVLSASAWKTGRKTPVFPSPYLLELPQWGVTAEHLAARRGALLVPTPDTDAMVVRRAHDGIPPAHLAWSTSSAGAVTARGADVHPDGSRRAERDAAGGAAAGAVHNGAVHDGAVAEGAVPGDPNEAEPKTGWEDIPHLVQWKAAYDASKGGGAAGASGKSDGKTKTVPVWSSAPQPPEEAHAFWPRPTMPSAARREARKLADEIRDELAALDRSGNDGGDSVECAENPWSSMVRALLSEAEEREDGASVTLPGRLNASGVGAMLQRPTETALALRRPMPKPASRFASLGTEFHTFVETFYTSGTAEVSSRDDLATLERAFLSSPWRERTPIAVERQIDLRLDGRTVVCKLDAVFEDAEGNIEIVDWKTGRVPEDEDELAARQLQLQLYTLAWASMSGVAPERIRSRLVYFPSGDEFALAGADGKDEIIAQLRAVEIAMGEVDAQ